MGITSKRRKHPAKGGALLFVLWVSAALSAIAFSVANTVRSEMERTGTFSESVRTHYLATSAMERALLYVQIGSGERLPDGSPKYYEPGVSRLNFTFPSGVSTVEIAPEWAKLAINDIGPPMLATLLLNLGAEPAQAGEIAAAIVDWRAPAPGGLSMFDQFYLARAPSFRARHASIEEIEELLLVKGMTPELFHGNFIRDAEGRLQPRAGLKDCVSVYGSTGQVDINTAEPAVLLTLGISPHVVNAIVERRRAIPFRSPAEIAALAQLGSPGLDRLTLPGTGTIYTLKATARLRLPNGAPSDLSRSVAATVKFNKPGVAHPIEILRWYEN
jgi:general secretion pathway protein K